MSDALQQFRANLDAIRCRHRRFFEVLEEQAQRQAARLAGLAISHDERLERFRAQAAAQAARLAGFRMSPLAANMLTLLRAKAPDQEREAALRWLRAWMGPAPVHPRRRAQLLGGLRRSGFLGPAASRALEERLLSAIVAAVAHETILNLTPGELESDSARLRTRVAEELTSLGRPSLTPRSRRCSRPALPNLARPRRRRL